MGWESAIQNGRLQDTILQLRGEVQRLQSQNIALRKLLSEVAEQSPDAKEILAQSADGLVSTGIFGFGASQVSRFFNPYR